MGLLVVAALLLLLSGSVGGADHSKARPDGPREGTSRVGPVIGVNANTQDSNPGPDQDTARALGLRLLREEIRWPEVEPQRGRFDDRRYDRLTVSTARRGMQILPLLFKTPPWLAAQDTRLPPSLDRWQRFVRHVVGRYGPGGVFWRDHPELDERLAWRTWEVWNEPYFPVFSAGGVDPVAYARLVRATVEAGSGVNPDTQYLAAAEAGYQAADGTRRNWAEDMFAADPGLGRLLGGLAVHPYTRGSPLENPEDQEASFSRLDGLLALARRSGVMTRRPLWVTELGWSTCPKCVSQAQQALYWEQAFVRFAQPPLRGAVAGVFAYNLRDLGGPQPTDQLADFGLITRDGRRKAAANVISRAASVARSPHL